MVCFAEYLSAGFPSAAEGYEDEPLNLHDLLVQNRAATIFYRVKGDELRDEYIRDGAILVVDRSITASAGRLVLTEEYGVNVVRRFKRFESPLLVVGVVVGVVMRF